MKFLLDNGVCHHNLSYFSSFLFGEPSLQPFRYLFRGVIALFYHKQNAFGHQICDLFDLHLVTFKLLPVRRSYLIYIHTLHDIFIRVCTNDHRQLYLDLRDELFPNAKLVLISRCNWITDEEHLMMKFPRRAAFLSRMSKILSLILWCCSRFSKIILE